MYRLWHWLFGWDYILWTNTADSGIAKVQTDYDGHVWYWRYRSTSVADTISKPEQVRWITCSSSKYFGSK